MRNDAEGVVEGMFSAWRIQDIEAVLGYCDESIRYTVHEPEGITGLGGRMRGKAEVRAYLAAVVARWEFVHLAPITLKVLGHTVRGHMRFHSLHRKTGLALAGTKRQVWRIENGLITECDEYQDAGRIKAFLAMAEAV